MGKNSKLKNKNKGGEKTAMKTDKKHVAKRRKLLLKLGEADITEMVATLEEEERRLTKITDTLCEPPSARSNFTFCVHPEKEELIIFGGEFFDGQKTQIYNDLFFYNIPKNEWREVKSPSGPAPRSGHQMVSVPSDGGQLWLFGGEHASPSQLQFYHYKDLWVLRLTSKKWEKIEVANGPSARSGHRMIYNKKKLFVFGGFHDNNQTYKYFNDVHIFSLESYSWLQIEVSSTILPPPRSGCCIASKSDGTVLIWGGYSKHKVKNNVDKGITHADMFSLVSDKTDPAAKFKWTAVKSNGRRPSPRSGVGHIVAPSGKVYCFGGVSDVEEDEESLYGDFSNELHSLDLTNMCWRLIDVSKKPSNTQTATDAEMLINDQSTTSAKTDGIFTISFGSSFTQPSASKQKHNTSLVNGPSLRMNPALAVCKGVLYIFGGIYEEGNKQHTLNDFYALDLHKLDDWITLIANTSSHEWVGSESESESSDSDEDNSLSSESISSEMDTD